MEKLEPSNQISRDKNSRREITSTVKDPIKPMISPAMQMIHQRKMAVKHVVETPIHPNTMTGKKIVQLLMLTVIVAKEEDTTRNSVNPKLLLVQRELLELLEFFLNFKVKSLRMREEFLTMNINLKKVRLRVILKTMVK